MGPPTSVEMVQKMAQFAFDSFIYFPTPFTPFLPICSLFHRSLQHATDGLENNELCTQTNIVLPVHIV